MIRYSLICKDCNINVESWFASSKEYEKLKKKKFLNCHICSSINIEKSLMAPSLINKKSKVSASKELNKYYKIKKTISEYQKFIKKNFDYVGENFAYKARSIHYENRKDQKGIYGSASQEELKELKEEGIETEMIPWIKDTNN